MEKAVNTANGYYKSELNKVKRTISAYSVNVKLVDSFGHDTKWLSLNEESIEDLIDYLKEYKKSLRKIK